MKIGDRVTLTHKGKILHSEVTYTDKEKSCGFVVMSPEFDASGTILGFKDGWFDTYWVVGLDTGQIVRMEA